MRGAILALLLWTAPAGAGPEVVADLSQPDVPITATFAGSDILVFGAIRDAEDAAGLAVIVTVAGPAGPVAVRRKDRVAGVWINRREAVVDRAPAFYAMATSVPVTEAITHTEDLRHAVTVPRAIRAVATGADETSAFVEALIRIRTDAGLYVVKEGEVEIIEGALFRAEIALPPSIVEGAYTARVFLTEEGRVLATYSDVLTVQKVGLERFLFVLAHERAALYGAMSLAVAIGAGWAASAAFGARRR